VNFGQVTPEIMRLMFAHPKSTVRVLHMLMHFSVGHVTLLLGEFNPREFHPLPLNFPPIGLRALGILAFCFAPNF